MNAGRSDVSFFVDCLWVIYVFYDDNLFTQTKVTMSITWLVCITLFHYFPVQFWFRDGFIIFV